MNVNGFPNSKLLHDFCPPSLVLLETATSEEVLIFGNDFLHCINDSRKLLFECQFKECLLKCALLLDITWEHLNTGHWKDVPYCWRKAYAVISLIKALAQFSLLNTAIKVQSDSAKARDHFGQIKSIIKTCDMGLLMGGQLPENKLSKLASFLHRDYLQEVVCFYKQCQAVDEKNDAESEPPSKRFKLCLPEKFLTERSVPVVDCPSVHYFQEHFYNKRMPVILKNCINHWPAMNERKWTLDYIKKVAGWRVVPVEVGSKYTDDAWSQKLMVVEDFIEKYLSPDRVEKEVGYLAQHQLFDQISDLREDVVVPDYCSVSCTDEVDVNAWFGPANTVSPLHRDDKENIFCQVFGQKYIRLYDPVHSEKLYVHENHLLKTTSQVDVENLDSERFPDFDKVPYLECTVSAGDVLYIPVQHWHYVRSLTTSFSVSFWWNRDNDDKTECQPVE